MRVVFMGTPEFAVPTLRGLKEAGHEILLVVSQPDRPVGRGMKTGTTPVKAVAGALGIPVVQPESLKDAEFRRGLEALAPDAIVVAAYGKILPGWLIDLPNECLNVHGSLLPAYRGAAPIQRAVLDGVTETGVTIMRVVEEMDAGDILLVRKVAIGPDETAGEIVARLASLGAEAMSEALDRLGRGGIEATAQNHAAATFAPKISKEEAQIDWMDEPARVRNLIRALNPSPGAFSMLEGERVKVLRATVRDPRPASEAGFGPGSVVALDSEGPVVLCGEGALVMTELKPAGKRAMSGVEFARGRYVEVGSRFGHD